MTDQSTSMVELVVDDGIAILTLNDPRRRNCVSRAMSEDVAAACRRIEDDRSVRAVVLTGAGSAFSAGGDLDALTGPPGPLAPVYEGFLALGRLTAPIVGAINGAALGAGMNFALACDVLVAGREARFDASFLDIAIHPGGGFLWRMNRAVGAQVTAAMVLFGEVLDADAARERGLVWSVVDGADLLAEARRLAAVAAGRSPELVRRTKATLRALLPVTDERIAVDLEQRGQEWSMATPAFAEAVRAKLEQVRGAGRPPSA